MWGVATMANEWIDDRDEIEARRAQAEARHRLGIEHHDSRPERTWHDSVGVLALFAFVLAGACACIIVFADAIMSRP